MIKSPQIDYKTYAQQMRGALSGAEICNRDLSLNHSYFNTKKGFYWSDKNNDQLIQGVLNYGLDVSAIGEHQFKNTKTPVELELRLCILFNVKDLKNVGEKELKEFKKEHGGNTNGSKK